MGTWKQDDHTFVILQVMFSLPGIIFPFPLFSCWTPLDPSQLNFFTYHLPIRMNYSHICRLFFAISESIEIYLSLHTCFTIRGLPRWQSGKETACQCRRRKRMWVWSLSQEDSPREGNGNLLQYSCLENPMDGEAWWATVHGVTKSQTWLSNFTSSTCIMLLFLC